MVSFGLCRPHAKETHLRPDPRPRTPRLRAHAPLLAAIVLAAATLLPARPAAAAAGGTLDELFRAHGVVAALVVESQDGQTRYVVNRDRAGERFSPASTFKIANTLIALDAGVVTSSDTPFKWDGTVRSVPQWNRDQTLKSAFRVSCVWCYQEIARKVGKARYEQALSRLDYGNARVGDSVDQFWLNGDLRISALEQIDFLRKLTAYALPYSRAQVDILREIMRVEQTDGYAVYAKSGWSGQVGWYVGFVELQQATWLFAFNLRVDNDDQVALRAPLTMEALRMLGILP